MLRPGDVLVTDFIDAERVATLDDAAFEPIATIRAGTNLGVSVSATFYRAANPWSAAADTRPAVMVLRASKPAVVRRESH